MSHELIILRHAKSDWDSGASSDFDRPLSRRGKQDAPRVGRWLHEQGLIPDHVISSPAKRAKKTARAVCEALAIKRKRLHFDERVYMADLDTLLTVISEVSPEVRRLLLVGHNPGLDELLLYLSEFEPSYTTNGKLLTTAAVACLSLPQGWSGLEKASAGLRLLVRPADIVEA